MEIHELISMSLGGPDEPAVFRESDFVLLIDDKNKGWVVRIADIALLEACGKHTRFHFAKGTALIRRSLTDCEVGWGVPPSFQPRVIVSSTSAT
jgi:hypothetical protein